jgi:hypothetical protein
MQITNVRVRRRISKAGRMIARALDPNTRLNWTAVAVWSVAALWLLAAWSVPALLFSRGMP